LRRIVHKIFKSIGGKNMVLISKEEEKFLNELSHRNVLVIPMNLPYQIAQKKDVIIENFEGLGVLANRQRKVSFFGKLRSIEDQKVPPHYSAFYMSVKDTGENFLYNYTTSRLFCIVEFSDEEEDSVNLMLKDNSIITKLIQRVLEIYMFNFNIESTGKEFFVPNAREVYPVVIFTSSNRSRNESKASGINNWGAFQLMASNGYNNQYTNIRYLNAYNDSWKYFLSRTLKEFKYSNYFETILFASLSFESYLHYVIRKNQLPSTYYSKNNQYLKVKTIGSKLFDNKYLSINGYPKDVFIENLKVISSNRNDIIHGKSVEIYNLMDQASQSTESLLYFYSMQNEINLP